MFLAGDIIINKPGDVIYLSKSASTREILEGNILLVTKCIWSNLENDHMIYAVELKSGIEGWVKARYVTKFF